MNTIDKKPYQMPQVECVALDSDISLTLDSSGIPLGDPEAMFFSSESLTSDPFGMEVL